MIQFTILEETFQDNISNCNKSLINFLDYLIAFSHDNDSNFPCYKKIGKSIGLSVKQVGRLAKKARDLGLLHTKRRFNSSNLFYLNPLFFELRLKLQSVFSSLRRFFKSRLIENVLLINKEFIKNISRVYKLYTKKKIQDPKTNQFPLKKYTPTISGSIFYQKKDKKVEDEQIGYYKRQQASINLYNRMNEYQKKISLRGVTVVNQWKEEYRVTEIKKDRPQTNIFLQKYPYPG